MALDKKRVMPPTFIPPYGGNYKFSSEADVFSHLHQTLPDVAILETREVLLSVRDHLSDSKMRHNDKRRIKNEAEEAEQVIAILKAAIK